MFFSARGICTLVLKQPKDVACISQVDEDLKQRGVYGLGGSLSVAKELRILWGPSYLPLG